MVHFPRGKLSGKGDGWRENVGLHDRARFPYYKGFRISGSVPLRSFHKSKLGVVGILVLQILNDSKSKNKGRMEQLEVREQSSFKRQGTTGKNTKQISL